MGEESGYIRFEVPEAGQKARAFAVMADEGGLTVKGHIVTLEPVTGMLFSHVKLLFLGSMFCIDIYKILNKF